MNRYLVHTFFGIALLTGLISSPGISRAHDSVWPGEKLARMYPGAQSFEQKNLYISSQQRGNIEKVLGASLRDEDLQPSIYFALVKKDAAARPKRAAVLIFIDAEGERGLIETGLVMGPDGAVKQVMIFENNEDATLSSPAFLGQFTGKKAGQKFLVGDDISAPTGMEKAGQAVASGVRRGLLIINELFRRR